LWNEEADVLGVLTVLRTGLHSMSPCGRRPARLSRGGARCCPSFFHCHSFFTARCLSFLAVLLPLLQCCSVGSSFCSPGSSLLSLLLAAVCATGSVAFSPRVCCVYYCLWCVCGCMCVCARACCCLCLQFVLQSVFAADCVFPTGSVLRQCVRWQTCGGHRHTSASSRQTCGVRCVVHACKMRRTRHVGVSAATHPHG
jgi:hypothetical protein